MPIYTKKGDRGTTSFISSDKNTNKRVSKTDPKVEALGAIDEVNSFIGIINSFSTDEEVKKFLKDIQKDLFTICSILAGKKIAFGSSKTKKLEGKIDEIDSKLPKINNFLYSQGNNFATHLMFSRSLVRRAERRMVALSEMEQIKPEILRFINRLSDLFFMLFRYANYIDGRKDEIWTLK